MTTEVDTQLSEHLPMSPSVAPKSEKKPEPRPRSHRDVRPSTDLVTPGTSNFTRIHKESPRTNSSSSCRFGSLSHHSFFSRHHPHPQHVGHIRDLTGNRVCTVRAEFSPAHLPHSSLLGCCLKMPQVSVPIGDPQSNREPLLYSEAWKKELKQLSARLAAFTTESEPRDRKEKEQPEKAQREHGARYSAQTGRLIPPPTRATSHLRSGKPTWSRYGSSQAFFLEDRDLLVLELLCQILQTDSLRSIQGWLLGASQREKDLAFSFLSTALRQLRTQTSVSTSEAQVLSQLQEAQEKEKSLLPSYRASWEGTSPKDAFASRGRGKGRKLSTQAKKQPFPHPSTTKLILAYHKEPIKLFFAQ
ncbi:protein TBATA [Sorex araneus]|uniref:protein TBATA n=1 Tax=Sorex araneus TaxID=42254 RepID=UPI0003318AB3|nr:protein TBATA [Sorex araneus]